MCRHQETPRADGRERRGAARGRERTPLPSRRTEVRRDPRARVVDRVPSSLKTVDRRHDWIMRQIGDLAVLPVVVWEAGLVDLVPECIDHALVGAAATTAPPC